MTEQPDNRERTRLQREPQRGSHDPSLIRDIIDTALVCHLGLTDHDGHPLVIPTIHARVDDVFHVHGSAASRTLRRLATGIDACCTITLLAASSSPCRSTTPRRRRAPGTRTTTLPISTPPCGPERFPCRSWLAHPCLPRTCQQGSACRHPCAP